MHIAIAFWPQRTPWAIPGDGVRSVGGFRTPEDAEIPCVTHRLYPGDVATVAIQAGAVTADGRLVSVARP